MNQEAATKSLIYCLDALALALAATKELLEPIAMLRPPFKLYVLSLKRTVTLRTIPRPN
jgi:hypothetical protein